MTGMDWARARTFMLAAEIEARRAAETADLAAGMAQLASNYREYALAALPVGTVLRHRTSTPTDEVIRVPEGWVVRADPVRHKTVPPEPLPGWVLEQWHAGAWIVAYPEVES